MKLTSILRGHGFGNLSKVRGLIYYKISPFEQRAFAGALTKGFSNTLRRLGDQAFRVVPPFIIACVVYDQAEKEHDKLMRKNPKDFECDE